MSIEGGYVLGLDLGVSSLGWAILDLDDRKPKPVRIRNAGVRIFEAGVEGDVEQGKDSSRAVQHREARQPRRQHWRRQHRKQKLFRLLQEHGLLPPSDSDSPTDRKSLIDRLDGELAARHIPNGDHLAHQKLPYLLRAKASRGSVEPHELGRALYHPQRTPANGTPAWRKSTIRPAAHRHPPVPQRPPPDPPRPLPAGSRDAGVASGGGVSAARGIAGCT